MHSSSVAPGYTVDSYTTTSPFFRNGATKLEALNKGLKSGFLLLVIGVGTVIIKKLQSLREFASEVNVIFFAFFNSEELTSLVKSIHSLRPLILFLLISYPITGNFLLNSIASGKPTYPKPTTHILIDCIFILVSPNNWSINIDQKNNNFYV
jgi:surface polysaccharide O-acyltransferase-like enzyme